MNVKSISKYIVISVGKTLNTCGNSDWLNEVVYYCQLEKVTFRTTLSVKSKCSENN